MKGKVAIVTAAGHGIGEAAARELAARGYRLGLMSLSDSSARLGKELGGFGISGSVTKTEDLQRLVSETLERYGRIDAVVNSTGRYSAILKNHGFESHGPVTVESTTYDPNSEAPLLELGDEVWHDALDTLMLNVVRVCRLVTEPMIRNGGGAIVNLSGVEAIQPRSVYPASPMRLALHGFMKLYADRYGRHGIRMNNLLPGFLENVDIEQTDIHRMIPLGRRGSMGEMAKTIAFLLSDDAGYISGQNIIADGALNRSV